MLHNNHHGPWLNKYDQHYCVKQIWQNIQPVHSSRMRTAACYHMGRFPDRDLTDRDLQTETHHWTKTLWTETALDRDPILDRDAPEKKPHRKIPLDRDPAGQKLYWLETPLDRYPPGHRPLDRDSPRQRPPGQRPTHHLTETHPPPGQRPLL